MLPTTLVHALSVRQPFAGLIAAGRKTVEIRPRRTNYRGELFIHAGMNPRFHATPDREAMEGLDPWFLSWAGYALARAELVECRPSTAADRPTACWLPPEGTWALELANVELLQHPVMARGRLGIFTLELPELIAHPMDRRALARALPEAGAPWDREMIEFAASFNGSRHAGGTLDELRDSIYQPALDEVQTSGRLPDRWSIEDLRALLFALYRSDYYGGGYGPDELERQVLDLVLRELRSRLQD